MLRLFCGNALAPQLMMSVVLWKQPCASSSFSPGSVFAFLSCSGICLPVSQHLAWKLLLWLSREFSFPFLTGRVGCWIIKKNPLNFLSSGFPPPAPDSFLMDRKGRLKPFQTLLYFLPFHENVCFFLSCCTVDVCTSVNQDSSFSNFDSQNNIFL